MGELKQFSKKTTSEIAATLEDKFGFGNKPYYDGGVHSAVIDFCKGYEPRTEFIHLSKLSFALIKLLKNQNGENFFKKLEGFKDYDQAFDRLKKFNKLMVALTHWHVDAFIQYKRMLDGTKSFSPGERVAIAQLYFEDYGYNQGEKKELREEVLTADIITKWLEEEEEAEME
jgi:hypothetical protein